MIRTQTFQVQDKELDLQLRNSKFLFNKAMYLCRQNYFENKDSKEVLRKVISNEFLGDRGQVFCPIKVNLA